MKTLCLCVALAAFSGLLSGDCSQPGTIAYYPLSATAENHCGPSLSTDLTLNGNCPFAASTAGCAALAVPWDPSTFNFNFLYTPTQGNFVSVPPAVLGQMANLTQYTIQFTYNQVRYGGGDGAGMLYIGGYTSNPPSPGAPCAEFCNGDTINPTFSHDVLWTAQNGELTLVTDEALEDGVNSTITCSYDGTNYYIYMDGVVAAGPIPDGVQFCVGCNAYTQIPGFSISAMNDIQFLGVSGCDVQGCFNDYYSNIQFSRAAFVPDRFPPCYAPGITFSPTPTVTGGCPVSVLKPPDLTSSVPHTFIETCTPAMTETPSATATVRQTLTPTPPACQGCSNGIPRIPQGLPGAWHSDQMDHTIGQFQTIGYLGCYLTCFSMIDPNKETPGQLNNILTARGDINSAGTLFNSEDAANYIGFGISGEGSTGSLAEGEIAKNVCKPDTYVIVGVNTGARKQHYVLVTGSIFDSGTQTCRFKINDPASANYQYLDNYTVDNDDPIEVLEILTKE